MGRMVASRLAWAEGSCPYCQSAETRVLGRKHLLLHLRRCARCGLMFRWPKDTVEDNRRFYQASYRQSLVDEAARASEDSTGMNGLLHHQLLNLGPRIALLRALIPAGRVLDYGSSWGYGTYQLKAAGYDAVGFEISRPRAQLARRRFGVSAISETAALESHAGSFDAVFASHVLEHLPSLKGIFERFARLLKPGGVLLIFVPNGGGRNARALGVRWGPMCCEEHPLAFDAEFFVRNLPAYGFEVRCLSDPYSPQLLRNRLRTAQSSPGDGDELVICAWTQSRSARAQEKCGPASPWPARS
jgi:2-polyprenyl-3-methyl-5-hydroxy-6-metoxy-1,4-benzoquinol methylase